jgi:predicted nucleic acid-binding protein
VPEHPVIIDSGPLVALLVSHDEHHEWATEWFRELPAPLLTCEAVLTEVFHLVWRRSNGVEGFFTLLQSGALSIDFSLMDEREMLWKLVRKYRDVPMSLADACMVRMAERHSTGVVLTVDSHFRIYRKQNRQQIATIMPEDKAAG